MVEAVEWWKVRERKSSRLVISFKVQTLQNLDLFLIRGSSQEKSVALSLIGSTHVVFGEKVKAREVSAFTMID